MASFVEDLWSSIFTPGPTPTLLIATNASFAALQLLLLALLLATYSVHFVVLSVLSAALWWSVNWFAREVRLAQAQEAEKPDDGTREQSELAESESDTETEGVTRNTTTTTTTTATAAAAAPSGLQPGRSEVRKRPSVSGDNSSGYGSTDSEWEKVEGQ